VLVQQFIEQWARAHEDLHPAVAQVDATGDVGRQPGVRYWPHNPWTHHPMGQSGDWATSAGR
jgi:hypothetical protein